MRRVAIASSALAALALAGCTSSSPSSPHTVVTGTNTITTTRTASPTGAVPAAYVPSRPASGATPKGEKKGSCPYIKAGVDSEPTSGPNVADLEGNRVGLVTRLPALTPVGCRFYFAYDRHPVADIQPYTYATATAARSAMIATGRAGSRARGYPGFADGVDGILFQTKFYAQDEGKDWAFVFAKGRVLVLVHTDQSRDNGSTNALNLARALVAKF